ncbi:group II intron maturase-specific domain-containing protein [Paraburkholderia tropica]|uniref:group II intron maturase-specific domain-containing protein n=1 Tax=Paraburkholderia tropica TaxID=92647 RepID=UPI002AB7A681|nr:group II intron maturase-specific domain-containing protein [Paraburkholderia tropica]
MLTRDFFPSPGQPTPQRKVILPYRLYEFARLRLSKILYCRDSNRTGTYPNVQFTFLGFTFRPREALNTQHHRRFTSFLPAVSNDALKRVRKEVREWRLHRRTSATLADLAEQCNPIIQGWWNYYGAD